MWLGLENGGANHCNVLLQVRNSGEQVLSSLISCVCMGGGSYKSYGYILLDDRNDMNKCAYTKTQKECKEKIVLGQIETCPGDYIVHV